MHACMRTTIELSDSTYQALRAEMLKRGERGFSSIVEQALVAYFAEAPERERLAAAVRAVEGIWSEDEADETRRRSSEAWSTWQSDRFSTPTS
jgi:inorganic triphosphatase YgiF